MRSIIALLIFLFWVSLSQAQVVSNAEEFLAAIGEGKRITLQAGTYVLKPFSEAKSNFISWEESYGVVIRGVHDFHIVAEGEVKLLAPSGACAVLTFIDCEDVSVSGVTAGHTPAVDSCMGGVFDFTRCRRVTVADCTLFGCGVRGLTLDSVDTFTFLRSTIEKCTSDIVTSRSSRYLRFSEAIFRDNHYLYHPFDFHETKDVLFADCLFEGNKPRAGDEYAFFQVDEDSVVSVRNSTLRKNEATRFEKRINSITCEDVIFDDNTFTEDLGSNPKPTVLPKAPKNDYVFRTLTVSTVTELIREIRPNEEIHLLGKEYLLENSSEDFPVNPFVSFNNDMGLLLKNLYSFKLIGQNGTRIIMPSPEAAVLSFVDCRECSVSRMSLGHVPLADGCFGPVLNVEKSQGMTVRDTVLFGCGTEGVVLDGVNDFRLVDSTIERCTSGFANLFRSQAEFIRVRVAANKVWAGFSVNHKSSLLLRACQIFDNELNSSYIFDVEEASRIVVSRSMIVGNKGGGLFLKGKDVELQDVQVRENEFSDENE